MPEFRDDDRVLVSPRYLAGGTDPEGLAEALGTLKHLFGWPTEHRPDQAKTTVTSPDESTVLTFEPMRRDDHWWHLTHHKPYWQAEFTRQTPAEAIAAVTQSLPQLLVDRRDIDRIGDLANVPDLSRTASGWEPGPGASGFTSPDGHCTLHHAPGSNPAWRITHSVHGEFNTDWTATFTGGTPTPLVAKFFAHLAAPFPVERRYDDIPVHARDFAVITPAHTTGLSPHIQHALARIPSPAPGQRPNRPRR